MNLALLLDMAADGFGDRVAVGTRAGGTTYAELRDRAGAGAVVLGDLDVAHVAFCDVNSPAFPTLLFASAWAGVPFVPLNYRLAVDQLAALLAPLAPAVLVGDQPALAGVARATLTPEDFGRRVDEVLASGGSGAPPWSDDGDAVAVLLHTSGTTAAPKAAILRHRHLVSYVLGAVEFMGAGDGDAALMAVPPYHVAGVAGVLTNVYAGRRLVPLAAFTPEAWLSLAAAEAVTNALVVPTMLARVVEHLDALGAADAGLPALGHVAYGGARMPAPVVERALALFGDADFVNAYGLTETSSTIAVLGPEDHRAARASADPAVRARLGSAGLPLPGVEVEIRGDDGTPCPAGVAGEIFLRGDQVSGEYVGHGARLDRDGWFATRDRGWLDAEGYLFVEGRADDTIIRGGENVAPAEIEECLLTHGAVADCAVVGEPDDRWGERIVAVVVVRDGATATPAELQAHVRAALRSARTPDRVELRAALPYTETGKLLRREVLGGRGVPSTG